MMKQRPAIDFGRDRCGDREALVRREWLVTNGIGGYAMGTVCGIPARSYHGLLVAATVPPVQRKVMLAKLDETATYAGKDYPLFANHWASGMIEPEGFKYLERFHLEGMTPVWTFGIADALLERRVWMQHGSNTTYVGYRLRHASESMHLRIKTLVTYRDHHATTLPGDWRMQIDPAPGGLLVLAHKDAVPLYLLADGAKATPKHEWYGRYYLAIEAYRGQQVYESYLYAGDFEALVEAGETFTFVASTDPNPNLDGAMAYVGQCQREQKLLEDGISAVGETNPAVEQLLLAADQFIVARNLSDDREGRSIIAGYPWFTDWGRDTMISLPGLTLAIARPGIARSILHTFALHVDQGMLPNRFPDAGETPEYNTIDATLWYFEAIRAYVATTGDEALLAELYPILAEIIAGHRRGTRYQIHVDEADGLLYGGETGVQLTWMDAKIDDWVVTPRIGKPVEINALWYNALCSMSGFAGILGRVEDAVGYESWAEEIRSGFGKYWNEETDYCFDVIDGPDGDDPTLRPNQLLAVSLPHSPLDSEHQKAVVDVCARHLLTSHGLRSLSPDHPDYIGHYGGDRVQRDAAYHQGTVWGWLIGPFVSAHLRVYRDPDQARQYLLPLLRHLGDHGVGSLSEVFDGDPPHTPRACIAQAWTVAEVLRTWREINDFQA